MEGDRERRQGRFQGEPSPFENPLEKQVDVWQTFNIEKLLKLGNIFTEIVKLQRKEQKLPPIGKKYNYSLKILTFASQQSNLTK